MPTCAISESRLGICIFLLDQSSSTSTGAAVVSMWCGCIFSLMIDLTVEYNDAICDGGLTSLSRALGSRSAVISTLGVGCRRSARLSRIWRSNEINQAFDSEILV